MTGGGVPQSACQWRRTRSTSPLMPPAATITDSRSGLEAPAVRLDRAREAGDAAAFADERIHAMAELDLEQVAPRMREQPCRQRFGERAPRAPDEVKARHGIAVAVQAALHPHRHRHELDAEPAQPFIDIGHAALDVVTRPGARPAMRFVEFAEGEPVRISRARRRRGFGNGAAAACRRTTARRRPRARGRPRFSAVSRSRSSTRRPRDSASIAAAMPAMPAPAIATSVE